MADAAACGRHHPTLQPRHPGLSVRPYRILQSAFRNEPNPRPDHRDSVPTPARRDRPALAFRLGLRQKVLQRATEAVAELCAVWMSISSNGSSSPTGSASPAHLLFLELTSDRIPALIPKCSVRKLPSGLDRQAWPRPSGALFLAQKFIVKKLTLIVKNKIQK
jgi:hypothetical protein